MSKATPVKSSVHAIAVKVNIENSDGSKQSETLTFFKKNDEWIWEPAGTSSYNAVEIAKIMRTMRDLNKAEELFK